MALLYPWATKEYILYHMSLGQVILYYNIGIETKFGKSEETLEQERQEKLRAVRDEMYENGLLVRDEKKEELKRQYGDIEDGNT
jgi:hypothetical protein